MIKFPYGMADFRQIVSDGYFYVDRTAAIPLLERGATQLFIRPRRFGKSLLLSVLENYYDIARKDAFDDIFGRLAVSRQPTPLRNRYFILRLDFSCVDPTGTPDDVKRSLYDHINVRIANFLRYYHDHGVDLGPMDIHSDNALATIESLLSVTQSAGSPIYLLIDEYDNFANTIMMRPTQDARARYEALVHDEGLLRTVFKVIKASTTATGFERVFITGVSPVVMSDITSGHNIAEDIFFETEFGDLCGFHEAEVKQTLDDIVAHCQLESDRAQDALSLMRTYYNGYCFVPGKDIVVYNPTLCLHFFKQFQHQCTYPRKMLDANLAVDQSKLAYVADIPGGRELILSLVEKGHRVIVADMADRFGLNEMLSDQSKDQSFMASFLYYFGVLTLAGETDQLQLMLKVPNLVMQSLYVKRVQRMLVPNPMLRDEGRWAAQKVYQAGEIAPLCAFVQDHLFSVFKNRDYAQANELTLKTAFLALLYDDILYIMDSVPELDRRYADLTMIIRPDKRHGKIFDVLIEFKFISLKALGLSGEQVRALTSDQLPTLPAVAQALQNGRDQARDYGRRLARKYPRLRLKSFVVVALGFERICSVAA